MRLCIVIGMVIIALSKPAMADVVNLVCEGERFPMYLDIEANTKIVVLRLSEEFSSTYIDGRVHKDDYHGEVRDIVNITSDTIKFGQILLPVTKNSEHVTVLDRYTGITSGFYGSFRCAMRPSKPLF